jgi:hypothetical protein
MVKRRAMQILKKMSDFDSLTKNSEVMMNLTKGVLTIMEVTEGENADMVLKMTCLDYLTNFYNDDQFKIELYAPILPYVVNMASQLLVAQNSLNNIEIVNEILELFRFIVQKYAGSQA